MRLLARKQEDFNKDVIAYVESSLKQKIIIQESNSDYQDWEGHVPELETTTVELDTRERCLVYHLAGYVLKHSTKFIHCKLCTQFFCEQSQVPSTDENKRLWR